MTALLVIAALALGALALWQRHERKRKAWLIVRESHRMTFRARPEEYEELQQLEAAYRLTHTGSDN